MLVADDSVPYGAPVGILGFSVDTLAGIPVGFVAGSLVCAFGSLADIHVCFSAGTPDDGLAKVVLSARYKGPVDMVVFMNAQVDDK